MLKTIAHATAAVALLASSVISAHAGDRYLIGHFGQIGKYSDRVELRMGAAAYDRGFFSDDVYDGVTLNGEILLPSPAFLDILGAPRPEIGVDLSEGDNAISFAYAGLTWDLHLTKRLFLTASGGGAITNAKKLENAGDYKSLGCRALFHLSAGIGYDITDNFSVMAYSDHFSNANLCYPNNGAESTGVRIGLRF